MTKQEMLARIQGWITDRSRTLKESLELAKEIRDTAELWIDALEGDLENETGN